MVKNKFFVSVLLMFIYVMNFVGLVAAQEVPDQSNQIGISIVFQTKIRSMSGKGELQESSETGHSWLENENVIHRIISDRKSGLYFGYDLVIEFDAELGKYKVSFKPLTREKGKEVRMFDASKLGKGTNIIETSKPEARAIEITLQPLASYPAPVLVEEGDAVEINILENAKSQEKLVDIIRVVSKSESIAKNTDPDFAANRRSEDKKTARDFTPQAIELKLTDCKLFINGKASADIKGTVAGAVPYIYLQDKGLYAFSLFPRPGYNFKKIGRFENNRISFEIDGNNYEIISNSPVSPITGNWNLWVLHNSGYMPQVIQSVPYLIGTIDSMKTFFKRN